MLQAPPGLHSRRGVTGDAQREFSLWTLRRRSLDSLHSHAGVIMSLACVASRALDGIAAPEVVAEVHLANGLPGFSMVGL